jgi:SRSO17 transposase
LLLERVIGTAQTSINAYLSNMDLAPSPEVLSLVALARSRVATFFEEATTLLGMGQYETRSWIGWHHHMTLVGLAHLLVTLQRGKFSTPS